MSAVETTDRRRSELACAGRFDRSHAASFALAGLVAVAFLVYALLARTVESPRIFDDELIYWLAGAGMASGDGLVSREGSYLYGAQALYPALLAIVHAAVSDRELAYDVAKTMNALAFALTAIPVYLLARRLLRLVYASSVACLSIAIPSAMYSSMVLTESVAYLAGGWAVLAVVLALERPTWQRQIAALLGVAIACTARLQFALLLGVYLLGVVVVLLLRPRSDVRSVLRAFSVPAGLLATAMVLVGAVGVSGSGALAGYMDLFRSYPTAGVGSALLENLGLLTLYLAVVSVVVAPVMLVLLAARARTGSERHAAFFATFVTTNAGFLLVTAFFDSSEYALGRVHDRYLFYVVPLWLLILFYWLQEGAPRRPRWASLAGAVAAFLPLALLPMSMFDIGDRGQLFDGVATTLWSVVRAQSGADAAVRAALLAFGAFSIALPIVVPRRLAGVAAVVVTFMFVANTSVVWSAAIEDARGTYAFAFGDGADRRWVDARVPDGATVATLYSSTCTRGELTRRAFLGTEFFNESVGRAYHFDEGYASILRSGEVTVAGDGTVMRPSRLPLTADFVLAPSGMALHGKQVAHGTRANLVLWEVLGPARLSGQTDGGAGCRGSRSRDYE